MEFLKLLKVERHKNINSTLQNSTLFFNKILKLYYKTSNLSLPYHFYLSVFAKFGVVDDNVLSSIYAPIDNLQIDQLKKS